MFSTRIFRGHRNVITSIDVNSNNHAQTNDNTVQLITGSDDKTIRFWDIETGKAKKCLSSSSHIQKSIEAVAIYDSLVYCGHSSSLSVFDLNNKNILISQDTLFIQDLCDDDISSITISHDGKVMAISDDNCNIKLFDRILVEPKLILNTSHNSIVGSVVFRPPLLPPFQNKLTKPSNISNVDNASHSSDNAKAENNVELVEVKQQIHTMNDVATGGFDCQVIISDYINGHTKSSINFSQASKNTNVNTSTQSQQGCQQLLNPPFVQGLGYIQVDSSDCNKQILVCALGDGSIRLLDADNAAVILSEYHGAHNGMITCMSTVTSTDTNNDSRSDRCVFVTGGVDRAVRVWTVVYKGGDQTVDSDNNDDGNYNDTTTNNDDINSNIEDNLTKMNITNTTSDIIIDTVTTASTPTITKPLTKLQKKKLKMKTKQKQLKAQQQQQSSSSQSSLYEIKLLYTLHHGEKINAVKAAVITINTESLTSSIPSESAISKSITISNSNNVNSTNIDVSDNILALLLPPSHSLQSTPQSLLQSSLVIFVADAVSHGFYVYSADLHTILSEEEDDADVDEVHNNGNVSNS